MPWVLIAILETLGARGEFAHKQSEEEALGNRREKAVEIQWKDSSICAKPTVLFTVGKGRKIWRSVDKLISR